MNTKEEAKKWIENGGACAYRGGFAWKGARTSPITKEKALELLPKYDFCKGSIRIHELIFEKDVLIFNEYTGIDLW